MQNETNQPGRQLNLPPRLRFWRLVPQTSEPFLHQVQVPRRVGIEAQHLGVVGVLLQCLECLAQRIIPEGLHVLPKPFLVIGRTSGLGHDDTVIGFGERLDP